MSKNMEKYIMITGLEIKCRMTIKKTNKQTLRDGKSTANITWFNSNYNGA